jgi:hypothetical protein
MHFALSGAHPAFREPLFGGQTPDVVVEHKLCVQLRAPDSRCLSALSDLYVKGTRVVFVGRHLHVLKPGHELRDTPTQPFGVGLDEHQLLRVYDHKAPHLWLISVQNSAGDQITVVCNGITG